jgi:hypothetical protein
MSSLTRSEEDKGTSGIPAPCVQMAIERERGRRCWQDSVEAVPALLRHAARGQVVHLVQEFETLQSVGPQGVEGPAGENLQSAGATPRPRACAAVQ